MKVLFHCTDAGDKVANNDAYFHATFCFRIEFHRKATVINWCELKKLNTLKMRLLLYMCNVIG